MAEKKKRVGRGESEPFQKGDDPRRVNRKGRPSAFTREIRESLLRAGNTFGNRVAAISNARLPKRQTKTLTQEILELSRLDPNGMESYFEWLAEFHPMLYVGLLGRYVLQATLDEHGPELKVTYRSPEQIEEVIRELGLPPLQQPKRIDLHNPPDDVIDVTPNEQ
jgi:hypothetical protein